MQNRKPYHILYIEDDPEMIDLVSLILDRGGYLLSGTCSGQQGIELIEKSPPDLILLDLMIPDLDGWDIYQKMKADPKTENIPVIIITAKSQPIDRVLGLHIAKVDDYLTKPFHPQELIDSIEKVLERKEHS